MLGGSGAGGRDLARMGGAMDSAPTPESLERLLTLVRSYRLSQAVYVATRLGIPDLLANGPRETHELARMTASHAPSLHRVLLALAGAVVLEQAGPRRFALTAMGAGLRALAARGEADGRLYSLAIIQSPGGTSALRAEGASVAPRRR